MADVGEVMGEFSDERLAGVLQVVERMAGGDLDQRIPLSERHDELDAIAHAVNVLVGELQIVEAGLRRAKEEAEAASHAKTIFLRNVSHELRTPLTVVLGMSDLIASGSVPPARIEQLRERILANGRALVTILDDLLDLAKIEAERMEFELGPVHLAQLAGEVVASLETLAARKQLGIALHTVNAQGAHVIADAKRLRQILMNVIGNAIKFTERGEVAVRITRAADSGRVLVDVVDSGIGMTRDQARVVFEPFMQANATIGVRYGGSGLGLAISKRLAEGMGCTLEVLASEPGVGTTLRLALPSTAPVAATAQPDRVPRDRIDLRTLRVLVVEDHADVRATTVELLARAGATVSEASNGLEAIELTRDTTFDAILMDVRMPVLDGIEATRRIRANGLAVPIIALTADAVPAQRDECMSAGCSGYLAKPLDISHLATLLHALVNPTA